MASIRQTHFSGGEIDPALHARTELDRYESAVAYLMNWLVTKQGELDNRPGLLHAASVDEDPATDARLIPFIVSADEAYILVLTDYLVRIYSVSLGDFLVVQGAGNWSAVTAYVTGDRVVAVDGLAYYCRFPNTNKNPTGGANTEYWRAIGTGQAGLPVEFTTPWSAAMLERLKWAQKGALMTLTSQGATPYDFTCYSTYEWSFEKLRVHAETTLVAASIYLPTVPSGYVAKKWAYIVKAVDRYGRENSLWPASVTDQDMLRIKPDYSHPTGLAPTLEWPAQSAAVKYRVYGGRKGVFGLLGETLQAPSGADLWTDEADPPDFSSAPYLALNPFAPVEAWQASHLYNSSTEPTYVVVEDRVYRLVYNGASGTVPPSGYGSYISDFSARWAYVWQSTASRFPACVAFHEQRRFFANVFDAPQDIWATKAGFYFDFSPLSIPPKDTDAFQFSIASNRYAEIRALVPFRGLIAMTSAGVFHMDGTQDKAMGPMSITVKQQSGRGISWLDPLVVGQAILYVEEHYNVVRDLIHEWQSDSFQANDLTLPVTHLFAGRTIVDWAFSGEPYSAVFIVLDDGTGLALTYSRERQQASWSRIETDGFIERVCVVPDGGEDVPYFLVRRSREEEGGAVTYRELEKLASRKQLWQTYGVFLDASVRIDNSLTQVTVFQVDWLAGRDVTVLADGDVLGTFTVGTNGNLTLPDVYDYVVAGLPYVSDVELLPPHVPSQRGDLRTARKIVDKVEFEVVQTRGVKAGPDFAHLTAEMNRQVGDSWGPLDLRDGTIQIRIGSAWSHEGIAVLRQDQPLPATIRSVARDVEVGGAD